MKVVLYLNCLNFYLENFKERNRLGERNVLESTFFRAGDRGENSLGKAFLAYCPEGNVFSEAGLFVLPETSFTGNRFTCVTVNRKAMETLNSLEVIGDSFGDRRVKIYSDDSRFNPFAKE